MFINGTQKDGKYFDLYCYCLFLFKILELTKIKYFLKFIIKVQKLGGLYKVKLVDIRSFKTSVKNIKMSLSYQSSRMYLIVYLNSKTASYPKCFCLLFCPVLVMY